MQEPRKLTGTRSSEQTFVRPTDQAGLSALLDSRIILQKLSFADYRDELTNKIIISFLEKRGNSLLSLDISRCLGISIEILPYITRHCSNLRSLTASHLPWKIAKVERFPYLIELDLSYCDLTDLRITDLPQLAHLRLTGCSRLSGLGNIRRSLFRRERDPWELPHLEQLDIADCTALKTIQLITACPLDNLKLDWSGCASEVLLLWLKSLLTHIEKDKSRYLTLSTKTRDQIELAKIFLMYWENGALQPPESLILSRLPSYCDSFELHNLLRLLECSLSPLPVLSAVKHLTIAEFTSEASLKKMPYEAPRSPGKPANYDHLLKISLLGTSRAGKSTLITRFHPSGASMEDVDMISIRGKLENLYKESMRVKFMIFERSTNVSRSKKISYSEYNRHNDVFILCREANYDFEAPVKESVFRIRDSEDQLGLCKKFAANVPIILCATRIDEVPDWNTSQQRAKFLAFAKENQLYYFECSAKTGMGVDELFLYTVKVVFYSKSIELLIEALRRNHSLLSIELPLDIPIRSTDQTAIEEILGRNRTESGKQVVAGGQLQNPLARKTICKERQAERAKETKQKPAEKSRAVFFGRSKAPAAIDSAPSRTLLDKKESASVPASGLVTISLAASMTDVKDDDRRQRPSPSVEREIGLARKARGEPDFYAEPVALPSSVAFFRGASASSASASSATSRTSSSSSSALASTATGSVRPGMAASPQASGADEANCHFR